VISHYWEANHHPVAVLNGDASRKVLEIVAWVASNVTLSAAGSSDPEDDSLDYSWSFYKQPSLYKEEILIESNSSASTTVTIPSDAGGKNIHIILQLLDDGSPHLYSYRRLGPRASLR